MHRTKSPFPHGQTPAEAFFRFWFSKKIFYRFQIAFLLFFSHFFTSFFPLFYYFFPKGYARCKKKHDAREVKKHG
jgi:hypothetical protein